MCAVHAFRLGDDLTPEQIAYYWRYGFIAFRNVIPEDSVAAIKNEIEQLKQRTIRNEIPAHHRDQLGITGTDADDTPLVHRMPYVTLYCDHAARIVHEGPCTSIAKGLIGQDAWLLQDTMGGVTWQEKDGRSASGYQEIRWHIDFDDTHVLFPVVSIAIYLDHSTRDNGCLAILPGSHLGSASQLREDPVYVEASPGDVVCHADRLLHASGRPAPGSAPRATLYVYACAGSYPGKGLPFGSAEQRDEARSLFVGARQ